MSSVYEHVDHLVTTLVEVGVRCDKIEVKILGFPLKKKGKKKQKNKLKKKHQGRYNSKLYKKTKQRKLSYYTDLYIMAIAQWWF